MPIGDFFSDVGTIITHPADDVSAVVHVKVDDVIDAIQGAPVVGGLATPIRDFVHGPLRDFAKTQIGAAVLTGVSVGLIVALPFVGPQLSFLAYATPGFIAGGEFGAAWVAGYVKFLRAGVKFLTQNQTDLGLPDIELPPEVADALANYTQQIQDGVKAALDYLHALPFEQLAGMTYDALSKALHIRYDSAVWALANARGNVAELAAAAAMTFDPKTGDPITPARAAQLMRATATLGPNYVSRQAATLYTPPAKVPKASLPTNAPRIAGRFLTTATGPDGAAAAAIANDALAAATPASSALPIVVGAGVVLAIAAGAAWWLRWRRK